MITHYKNTHLEDFVEQLYEQHKISKPEEITVPNVSKQMNIIVKSIEIKTMKGSSFLTPSGHHIIFLDKSRSHKEQRVDFFHELGHLLRHSGNQLVMPKQFAKYQEWDAELFVLYSLMPISMIKQLRLSPDRKQAIQQLAETFTVGTELASKRYDQIMRREIEGTLISETAAGYSLREVKPINVSSPEFYVYYDPTGTTDGPSQMIVVLDEWSLMNQREIDLPIYDRLPEMDQEDVSKFDGVTVHQSDVICWDGRVTLQVHELLFRHGLNRQKFIIHMNNVEMLIARDHEMTRRMI